MNGQGGPSTSRGPSTSPGGHALCCEGTVLVQFTESFDREGVEDKEGWKPLMSWRFHIDGNGKREVGDPISAKSYVRIDGPWADIRPRVIACAECQGEGPQGCIFKG